MTNHDHVLDPAFPLNEAVEQVDITAWFLIFGTTLCVLLLSFFSGFKSFPVPADLAWQFSPIGLLNGVRPEYLALDSHGFFLGHFAWSLDYLIVFFKTCLLESPFYFYCFRGEKFTRGLSYLLTANFLTHPLIFFFVPTLFDKYITAALVSEAFAPAVEMAFVVSILMAKKVSRGKLALSALIILLANLFSWEAGMYL
jgi:hypothetical protein